MSLPAAAPLPQDSEPSHGFPPDDGSALLEGGLLGRSVMKWGADGELSALDLQQVLTRLSQVDAQAAGLMQCEMGPLSAAAPQCNPLPPAHP